MLRQQARDEAFAKAIASGAVPEDTEDASERFVGAGEPQATLEPADWEDAKAKPGKKKRVKDADVMDGSTSTGADACSSVGLGNRYGENNCYLNVVAQTLFRVQVSYYCRYTVRWVPSVE